MNSPVFKSPYRLYALNNQITRCVGSTSNRQFEDEVKVVFVVLPSPVDAHVAVIRRAPPLCSTYFSDVASRWGHTYVQQQ